MSWKTWSPFQSPEVKEICAHMTLEERTALTWRGALYGLWCAATFAIPLSRALVDQTPSSWTVAGILCTIHIIAIPFWLRAQRRFLCGTTWARTQGLTPDRLRLFHFCTS